MTRPPRLADLIGLRPSQTTYPIACPRCSRPVLVTERLAFTAIGPEPVRRPTHWTCQAPRHATMPGLFRLGARARHYRDLTLAGTAAGTVVALVQLAWTLR